MNAHSAGVAANDTRPPQIFLLDESILRINGLDFSAALLDGNFDGKFREFAVTGHLADGTPFPDGLTVLVENGHENDPLGAPHFEFHFESVPEPAALALLSSAAPSWPWAAAAIAPRKAVRGASGGTGGRR